MKTARETRADVLRKLGQPVDIRKRKFTGSARESELPIVPTESQGQHNLERGKGQYLYRDSEEGKERRLH